MSDELDPGFDIHYGGVGNTLEMPEVYPEPVVENDEDDDEPTSEYVKAILGFDPDEFEEEGK